MTYNGGNGAADNSLSTYKVVRVGDIAFEGHTNKEHAYGRFVLNDAGDGLMSPRFSCLRPIVEQRYSFWKHYIPRESMMRPVLVNATKSGTMMNELVPADLMRESILVPVLYEQEAIGRFFKQLDDLITLHQCKCQHCSLCGYLSWEQRKLREVAHRVIQKNEGNQSDLPLTISAQHGLVDQRDYFNNQVASRDMSGYYLLENGEFAYNKSTSGDSPWGAIKRLIKYEKGCLSTLYICFGLDLGDPDFLVTYYETNRWHGAVQMIAAEGARNHGLLNIAPDDFFETVLTLPCSTEEQKQIGCFFTQLNSLITLHR